MSHTLACHVNPASDVTCMNEQFKGGVAVSHICASLFGGSGCIESCVSVSHVAHISTSHVSVSDVTCMNVQFKRGVAVSHVASLFGESCRTHC